MRDVASDTARVTLAAVAPTAFLTGPIVTRASARSYLGAGGGVSAAGGTAAVDAAEFALVGVSRTTTLCAVESGAFCSTGSSVGVERVKNSVRGRGSLADVARGDAPVTGSEAGKSAGWGLVVGKAGGLLGVDG